MIKKDKTHLTLHQRRIIQSGIEVGSSKVQIASVIGKDPSTVGKEIKMNLIDKRAWNYSMSDNHIRTKCNRRDRSPGACNGCSLYSKCNLRKFIYDAEKAQSKYESRRASSREGIMITDDDVARLGKLLAPLIEKGQSLSQIFMTHSNEIPVSESTLYKYIDLGVFREYGIINLSLKDKVSRRPKVKTKPRKSPANYTGHTYQDYLMFRQEHPELLPVEMDTVYNHPSGPYIQTLILPNCMVMIGFIHDSKTSLTMANSLYHLHKKLGSQLFKKLFSLLLTDRGVEFEIMSYFEFYKGQRIGNIFYCDPQCSFQKPHVECNHNYVRDIIPNGYDISELTQDSVDTMFLHINNTPRKSLGNKTPIEMMEIYYPEEYQIMMNIFNLRKLDRDEVTLKPILLKK